jgi:hypothetical protein
MKELSLNKLESLEGGKFWGKTCGKSYPIGNKTYRTCKYQAFWITYKSGAEEVK